MKRGLTERQKSKGLTHIENAENALHKCYVDLAIVIKLDKRLNHSLYWNSTVIKAKEYLQDAKDRLSKLERKYL
jgi:hypothetical protein